MPNYLDELTLFLLSKTNEIQNMSICEIYNAWARTGKACVRTEADMARCIELIRNKDIIIQSSDQLKRLMLYGMGIQSVFKNKQAEGTL